MDKTDEVANRHLEAAAIASVGAAVLHAATTGIHTEHLGLTRIFIVLTLLQLTSATIAFVNPGRLAKIALIAVNTFAVVGWAVTRVTGVSWIEGLEVAESAQLADTIAAALALVALLTTLGTIFDRLPKFSGRSITTAALLTGLAVVPGLVNATSHKHLMSDQHGVATDTTEVHDTAHAHETTVSTTNVDPEATAWPRPWDPTQPIDFSGVAGVTPEQRARAEKLVADTLRDLPEFADVTTIEAKGYKSIGDSITGFEHYVNYSMLGDTKFLDPTAPESLVYEVHGDHRTLVSAMFIATATPIDDPELIDFAGPLMQWHVHQNLCWGLDANGQPKVVGVLVNPGDVCPPKSVNAGGDNPMVHVWIAPHECGPFAALEGHGAGQTDATNGTRADQCSAERDHEASAESSDESSTDHSHSSSPSHGSTPASSAAPVPFDPSQPVDLSGTPGVTAAQLAFAENLVTVTIRDLPQWRDLAAVAAAGFHSIGDGATGFEHFIQWDWIDDDVYLNPNYPESLVFVRNSDGSKKLVSAMFMLPPSTALADVPDWGGALMQWHEHGNLCFTNDPVAPQVAGTKPIGSSCTPPLVDFPTSPMIHVWITAHRCGPFAALEGVAGGQVLSGETVFCDTAHGSH